MYLNITFVHLLKVVYNSMLCGIPGIQQLKALICKGKWMLLGMLLCSGFCQNIKGQDRLELGFLMGASYYFGDLNPGKQFYQPSAAFGGVGRYVLNDRYAVKGSIVMATIKGSYPDNGVYFPDGEVNYSFDRKLAEAALQLEFNFMSYDHWFIKDSNFTPFVSLGLATTAYKRFSTDVQNPTEQTVFILSLPFGAGLKYKINQWVRVGIEWNFRKTFVDDLDVVGHNLPISPNDPYGFDSSHGIHNNDWYSFAAGTITFSLFKRKNSCNGGF